MKIKTSIAADVLKKQGIKDEQIKPIIDNAINVFDHVPNKLNNKPSNVGLIVGKVQSGKTSVIIATAGVAFENGSRVVIALLSDTEILLTQNANRIKETFSSYDDIHIFAACDGGDFSQRSIEDLNCIYDDGGKIFICSLKNKTRIKDIVKKLSNTGFDKEPILIFDDEGDDISQNSLSPKKKFSTKETGEITETDFSSTNRAIKDLKEHYDRVGYVSVTATPQSIVLLQSFQHLSTDYIITTSPGVGYCGLSYFHSQHRDQLITVIKDDKNILNKDYGIPPDLKNAFARFVAGCIVRSTREKSKFKHSMLIHTSRLIAQHENMFQKISTYYQQLKSGAKLKKTVFTVFFKMVKDEYQKITNSNKTISIEQILFVFKKLRINKLNKDSTVKDIKEIMKFCPFHVFIGGDLLDRGVTIDGLAVVYIARDSKYANMDTLLQRARWFGYKASFIDTCQVYMTEKLDDWFVGMVSTEEHNWDMLEYCSLNNYSPRDIDFDFRIDVKNLSPTSKNKASFYNAVSNLTVEQHYINMNKKYNQDNIELIEKLITDHKKNLTYLKSGPQTHNKFSLSLKDAIEFLSKFHFTYEEDSCSKDNFEKTAKLLKYSKDDAIDFIIMSRPDNVEKRSTIKPDTNKIVGLLQGHSVDKDPSDPKYYKGDRYLVEDNIMIQVHYVTLKNNVKLNEADIVFKAGTVIPMLAWFFPKSCYTTVIKRKKLN